MLSLTALLLPLATTLPAADARPYDPEAHARAIAPFVEGRTCLVLHVDFTQIDPDALADRATLFMGKDAQAHAQELLTHLKDLTKDGAHDAYMVLSLADVPERSPFFVLPVKPNAAKGLVEAITRLRGEDEHFEIAEFDGAVVVAQTDTVKRLRDLKPEKRPELAKAFTIAGPGLAHAIAVPPTDLPRILEELMPKLPSELGEGSIKVLTRGLQAATLSIDAPPKLRLRVTIQAADKENALALNELLKRGAEWAIKLEGEGARKLLKALTPAVEGDRLTLSLDEQQLVKAFEEPAERVREAAERTRAANNMKQIGLAMHNYLDSFGRFPAAANFDKDDKPLLSWRVHLLPFLDQDALYKEFHLDEPWNSEHNKKLMDKMPDVFRSTADGKLAKAGKTTYLVPRGKETMFPPETTGIRIQDITDGTANTIMLVDVADERAVIWTKPDDIEIKPEEPQKGLAARARDAFQVLFADGSVHMLPKDIDKKTLWALFTIAGGEVVEIP
jgi:hypothetical protein